jgi:hypothetical protein
VSVDLLNSNDIVVCQYLTNETGQFTANILDEGVYRVRARRIGFISFVSDPFVLSIRHNAVADIRLRAAPIRLDPIEVTEDGLEAGLVREGFYRRKAMGFGHFRTPRDLGAMHLAFPEDLFTGIISIRVSRDGLVLARDPPCPLTIAIDRLVVDPGGWTELVHVSEVAAIEVYPRPGPLPPWLSGLVSPCGAVVIWTKHGAR